MTDTVRNREAHEAAEKLEAYEWGFSPRHRAGIRAQGPQRRHRPLHLRQEKRARVDARMAAQGLSRLARDGGSQLGQARHPRNRLSGRILLRRAQGQAEARKPRRGRSRNSSSLRKARHPDRGAEGARRGRGRAQGRGRRGVRQRQRRHHLPRGAEEGRSSLPLDQRGDPRISRAGAQISRQRGPAARQLFRLPEQRGLFRRHLRLRARGRPLPDGAVDLFPHQCREHRPVRAHADRRRQGQLRLLPRRLHRADARREPAARRGGRNLSRTRMRK